MLLTKPSLILCAAGLVAIMMVSGCQSPAPALPAFDTVAWSVYHDDNVGYSLAYPDSFVVKTYGDGEVAFTTDGHTAFRVAFVTDWEADKRGLWVKHQPVEAMDIAGRPGHKYIYDHYDGPFSAHTVTYAIEYSGKLLGLEFRTNNNMLNDVQKHVLDSFTVAEPNAGE